MFKFKLFFIIFQMDTFFLILGLMVLWFSISLYVDSNFTIKDLKPHTGILTGIDSAITKIKDKPLFQEITKELYLSLNNESKKFTHITTGHFGNIVSNLKVGDSIMLYSKPKLWGIFGLKRLLQ